MTDEKHIPQDKFPHIDGKVITDIIPHKRKEPVHDQWNEPWKASGAGLDEQVFNRLPFGSDEQRDKMYYSLLTDHLKTTKKAKKDTERVKLRRVYKKEKQPKPEAQTGVKEVTKTQT
jgi:hypothetical protein